MFCILDDMVITFFILSWTKIEVFKFFYWYTPRPTFMLILMTPGLTPLESCEVKFSSLLHLEVPWNLIH